MGWLNGWIPVAVFYGFFFYLLKIFPQETVDRLYDDAGWNLEIARPARIGLPFALAAMILILFTPLKFGQPIFWIGLILAILGQIGFISSLHSFNITPLNEPVRHGLYNISRNPQWVTFAMVMIGFSFMVGSWTVLALLMVRVVMNHFRILGEERALEEQYGDSYRAYLESSPRYLIFF
jgi:protein-S-isoprenylcysteine O-methyltransferase Ste14